MNKQRKVAEKKSPTSVNLSPSDRRDLRKLSKLKYGDSLGITSILRVEGMAAVTKELERLTKEKEVTS